jgi:hypothetical protein
MPCALIGAPLSVVDLKTHLYAAWTATERRARWPLIALATTVEEFCRSISAALDNQGFETKRKILRLAVERVEFVENQITVKLVIPTSDIRLQGHPHRKILR